jgi:hypothetical protein
MEDEALRRRIGRQSRTRRAEKKSSGRHAEMQQAESKQLDGAQVHENGGSIGGGFGLSRVNFEDKISRNGIGVPRT